MGALQRRLASALAVFILGAIGANAATAADTVYKDREYNVQDGLLKWGKQDAQFTAIHVPDLADPATSAPDLARKLNAIGKVGGQAVVYDLHGFNDKGSKISEAGLQAFRDARHQHDWRRMNAMCRIFGDDAPADFAWRRKAVKTAAKALRDERKAVYWIDGPDVEKLIAIFHKNAPDLVVAAHEGGDVHLVRPGESAVEGMPNIFMGGSPALDGSVNVVLPAGEASYQALETASIQPVELEPWEPDNSVLSEEERAEGFIALFDGKTLKGWHTETGGGVFVVEDGTITRVSGTWSQLRTRDRYDNFILRLEWRMVDGGNSGVFIRGPRAARYSKIGMEFQLLTDGATEPTNTSLGAIYEAQPPLAIASKPAMEWNTVEITADGPHLEAWLNGVKVQDIDLDAHEELQSRLRDGFIALQDHGNLVQFRNIRLKEL